MFAVAGPLRGRDAARRRLGHLIRDVQAGHAAAVAVWGGWGSGRTRLLQEAVAMAEQSRVPILTGAAGDPPAGHPALVAIDDPHLRDPAEIRAVFENSWPAPLGWIIGCPYGAAGAATQGYLARLSAPVEHIELPPLPEQAVAQLAADRVHAPAPELLDLLAGAGGNPRLVVELLDCVATGDIRPADRAAVEPPPPRLRRMVMQCLGGMSGACRQALQVASVLGARFAAGDLAQLLGSPVAGLLPALEDALAAGLLSTVEDQLAFAQEVFWRAVRASVAEPVRRALVREAGLMLMGRGGQALAAAPHLSAAARGDDQPVLRAMDRAVHEVRVGVPGLAADLAHQALDLTPVGDPSWPSRVLATVGADIAAGRLTAAESTARQALPCPATRATMRLRATLAALSLLTGRAAQARAVAQEALSVPEVSAAVRQAASSVAILALSLLDGDAAAGEARQILAECDAARGTAVVAALLVSGGEAWRRGRLDDGIRLAREATLHSEAGTGTAWRQASRLALAEKLIDVYQLDAARTLIEQLRQVAGGTQPWSEIAARVLAGRLAARTGQLTEARADAWAALRSARRCGAHLFLPPALSVLALVALHTGDVPAAAGYVGECRALLDAGTVAPGTARVAWAHLRLVAMRDGPRPARELLSTRYPQLVSGPELLAQEPCSASWLVRLGLAATDRRLAAGVVATAAALAADSPGIAVAAAAAHHAEALLNRDTAGLAEVAARHPDPWARACAAEDAADSLRTRGRSGHQPVAAYLGAAFTGFTQIGARGDAARVAERLRRLGVRVPATPAAEAESDWDGLTDTERTIAYLVGQGLTNRQIAARVYRSPHTVNYHLRRIFDKLGIGSRAELARLTEHAYRVPPPAAEAIGEVST